MQGIPGLGRESKCGSHRANDQESVSVSTPKEGNTSEPIWQVLINSDITLTMDKLLRLIPRFRQVVENQMQSTAGLEISASFAEANTSPAVVDHHNPVIKIILRGQDISGCIVDGGSGVNVISTTTCT